MSGFVLHPEAYADLDEIWEYIEMTTLTLPIVYSTRFTKPSARSWPFPAKVTLVPTSLQSRYDFIRFGTM